MEMILQLFLRTLMTSVEAALLVGLLLLLTITLRRKLSSFWRYALWMLLVSKLMLPLFPGDLENNFQWVQLPDMINGYTEYIDQSKWQELTSESTIKESHVLGIETSSDNSRNSIPEMTAGGTLIILQIAAVIWILGTVTIVLNFLVGYIKMSFALRKQEPAPIPREIKEQFAHICNKNQIRSNVRLKMTNDVATPTLFGLRAPIILIPQKLVGKLNSNEWECVFRHELVHLQRMDVLVNMILFLLVAVHWFNPALWYGMHRMRLEQESACDAKVLDTTGNISTYAISMVKVLENGVLQRRASIVTHFLDYKNNMMRRIIMIRNFQPKKKKVSLLGFVVLIISALITLPSAFAVEEEARGKSNQISFISPVSGTISSEYSYRIDPISREETLHEGIDIMNTQGTEVYAAGDGIVVMAGYNREYGNMIVIKHNESLQTEYRHLKTLKVKKEDVVKSGDLIGYLGSTGRSTGPHLHFSILLDGEYIDPKPYLSETK